MDSKIKNVIKTVNYTFLTIAMIACAFLNIKNSITIIFLYFIMLSSYTIRIFFAYDDYENKSIYDKRKKKSKVYCICLTYAIEILITLILQKYDTYLISFIILLIIVEDVVLNQKFIIALSVSFFIYTIFSSILYIKYIDDISKALINMILSIPIFIIVFIIFYLINYLLKQNDIIKNSLNEITISKIEKDNLYKDLKEAYSNLESVTTLRERNRIAAQIHDTVGHTLTTVLVELEACKRLMNKDLERSLEKLNLAQGQVRSGLNNIRSSVRILERGEDILNFSESLGALLLDTQKHSEVVIEKNIDININISKNVQEIIYLALMEGLTNGIRHGQSTAFIFKLYNDENSIYFYLEDNGKGSSVIVLGFGLRAMKSRVLELGGTLETVSKQGEGFKLYITIPF